MPTLPILRLSTLLALLLLGCSCDGSGSRPDAGGSPDAGSSAPLAMTVLLRSGQDSTAVELRAREVARPCSCTSYQWPALGTCETWSDHIGCDCRPPPGSCIASLRAERGGTILAELDPVAEEPFNLVGLFKLQVPGAWAATDLVVEGCGGEARIALPASLPVAPFISELTREESSLTVHWISAQLLHGALLQTGWTLLSEICHEPPDGATSVTSTGIQPAGGVVSLFFDVLRREAQETPLGAVEIYGAGGLFFWTVFYPAHDGTTRLPTDDYQGVHVEAWVTEGDAAPRQVELESATLEIATGKLLVEGAGVSYHATSTGDVLTVGDATATFAHVEPLDPLELGQPEDETFAISVGPVVASGGTPLTFAVTWELGVTARPAP